MNASPRERDASGVSRLLFSWTKPVLAIGMSGRLSQADMCRLDPSEDPAACGVTFARALVDAQARPHPVLRALVRVHRRGFIPIVCLALAHAVTGLVAPYFLRELLVWLREPDVSRWRGLGLASAIFLSGATSWLAIAHAFFRADKLALRIRAGLVMAIYRKMLVLGSRSDQDTSARVLNLLSTDVERVMSAPGELALVIMSVAALTIAIGMLWTMLGLASLAGVFVLAALVPVSRTQARSMQRAATRSARASDRRIGFFADIVRGIRAVKLAAWEKTLGAKIEALRTPELAELRRISLRSAALSALFLSTPVLVAFAVFSAHVALGRQLDMATAFAAITIFGLLRPVMLHFPALIANLVQDRASLLRIEAMLGEPEIESRSVSPEPRGRIAFRAARIGWGDVHVLEDVELVIEPGELVAVSGSSGAGKTTLLHALLGETTTSAGELGLSGTIAFAPQQPFVIAGTVRDNIVLGAAYDERKYKAAVFAACLEDDIAAMPARDDTELAERGANLSGGQRQRLSLARAIYADADIVFLDDPLSGLDAILAAAIVERAFIGALAGKTRVVVTSRRDVIQRANRLVEVRAGRLHCLAGDATAIDRRRLTGVSDGEKLPPAVEPAADDEQRAVGAVAVATYHHYLRALLPGWLLGVLAILFVGRELVAVGADYWLSASSATARIASNEVFIAGFAALAAGTVLFTYLRGMIGALRGVAAASSLHAAQARGILRSPLAFFQTTPVGRLVNRLSRDQRIVDQQLAPSALEWLGTVFLVLSTVIVIAMANPIALIAIFAIGFSYHKLQQYFRATVRDLRRLDAVARSPLIAHVAETVGGVSSIRAFAAQPRFERAALAKLELSQRSQLTQEAVRSWISVRLDLLGSTLAGTTGLIAVLGKGAIDPRLAALSMTYATVVTYTLGRMIRTSFEVESNMSAIERVKEYADLPAESRESEMATPAQWPASGAIELEEVQLRYRADLPLALRGVSLRVEAGEKIAIVGRSGSGKSSMIAAVCRLVELAGGSIKIDGIDLATLRLSDLRGSLTVIPQDPFLFRGSVRENLDPDGDFADSVLWNVLSRAGVERAVRSMPSGLDTDIGGDSNLLSAGQRQLLCIARALLRPSRIVILDEITANIDAEADLVVRDLVLREFAASTVLMIAHRMDATYAYDRVIVMDDGRIVDIGTPRALLEANGGAFARLARAYAQD